MWFASAGAEEPRIDFNRDIRPILSDKCFHCHGPDAATREADLRLDHREGLLGDRGGYAAFVGGDVEQSEAFRRITSDDESERMPPPDAKKQLTAAQVKALKTWIEQGAKWQRHWAFAAPQRPTLPSVKDSDWPRSAIDRFVLSRLESEGLAPSAPADRYTLARRVYFDLTGLPPTPAQADAFVSDAAPDAYERLVDRLLASPEYGQRWARKWLDLARYADTNGYEKDREREIWPYRDWVVEALNADMPLDQFTVEQIAGDMLPRASLSQRIATGFHRNTMLNEEGGIDPLEFRFHAMTDRVATTGTTWLGLTLGCTQCHDHKYDPVTQREYYQLMALLNNADEPEMEIPDPALDAVDRQNRKQADQLARQLPRHWPVAEGESHEAALDAAFTKWLKRMQAEQVSWTSLRPVEATSNLPLLTIERDDAVFASGDTAKVDVYTLRFQPVPAGVTAIRLEALPDARLPEGGPGTTYYEGTRGDFFLGEIELFADGEAAPLAEASHSFAANRFGKNPVSAELAIDGDLQTGWSVHGRQGERHVAVFCLNRPLASPDQLQLRMTFGRHFASSLGRFRIAYTTDSRRPVSRDLTPEVEALLARPFGGLSADERWTLREAFLLQAPELEKHAARVRELRKPRERVSTLVFQERPPENPRPTYLHRRGEYLQPTEPVEPAAPQVLPPLPQDAPRDRLALARWLVSRQNPLTARVVVNRQWAAVFGRGLVPTVDDFGMQGEPPSHPLLLDWLAVEFMQQGWSLKRLHRMIVLSATYRQSSHATPDLLARDADNVLLARGPRLRLEAEMIRDATLAAAGVLTRRIGGPPVRPPQPDGVTESAYGRPSWNASQGGDRYRRSLYTFVKRTAPFAMYNTFDAPSGEACVARRDVSNTALQALTLLNDVMFMETARHMGRSLSRKPGSEEERLRWAFRRLLTRPPRAEELTALKSYWEKQRERLLESPPAAATIAGVDRDQGDADDAVDRAAWTLLARALFSLDEAVTKD